MNRKNMIIAMVLFNTMIFSLSAHGNSGNTGNTELQKLYNDLVAEGSKSLGAAVKVGSTIEDLDIYYLERLMKKADNDDIFIVYQNLLKGSRNHLRAFDRQLQCNRASYTARFLSRREYYSIAAFFRDKPKAGAEKGTSVLPGGVCLNSQFCPALPAISVPTTCVRT